MIILRIADISPTATTIGIVGKNAAAKKLSALENGPSLLLVESSSLLLVVEIFDSYN